MRRITSVLRPNRVDPNRRFLPCGIGNLGFGRTVLLSNLRVFDGDGRICPETLERMLDDPKTAEELKESIRTLKMQIGLGD